MEVNSAGWISSPRSAQRGLARAAEHEHLPDESNCPQAGIIEPFARD
jgi:hypothetical protein